VCAQSLKGGGISGWFGGAISKGPKERDLDKGSMSETPPQRKERVAKIRGGFPTFFSRRSRGARTTGLCREKKKKKKFTWEKKMRMDVD